MIPTAEDNLAIRDDRPSDVEAGVGIGGTQGHGRTIRRGVDIDWATGNPVALVQTKSFKP